ncbi:MAG: helix-turn-helix domain-containing protein [Actinomycetota bacterium]
MSGRAPYRKREDVTAAILGAAEDLLATRSPSEVSLREIARRAGVQHSLITRHFGTKDNLVAAVVQRTLAAQDEALADTESAADAFTAALEHIAAHPASYQAVARAVIDPERRSAGDLPTAGFEMIRERLANDGQLPDDIDVDIAAVALMAFASGWGFLEDRWLATAGLGDADRAVAREQVALLMQRLLGPV